MPRTSPVVTLPASQSPLHALAPDRLPAPRSEDTYRVQLTWLVQLRWGVMLAQLVTILIVHLGMHIKLPIVPVLVVVATEAASNALFSSWSRRATFGNSSMLFIPMAIDVILLTALLFLTGGPFNPFSFLYLVNVALAAVVLPPMLTWSLVGLALACFGMLFIGERFIPLSIFPQLSHADQMRVHMQGMWFAFAVSAVFITYFVSRLRHGLAQREIELTRARSLASQSEKLASLATLATGAAHELSTPLSTIAVIAKELERALAPLDETARNDAQLIRREVERCREILQRMAADAGGQTQDVEERPLPLVELLKSSVEGLPRARDIRLTVAESASDCVLRCQAQATAQALRGMLKNALQASPPEKHIEVSAQSDGKMCRVAIRDFGPGMSADVLARAGEPFFTTKEPGEGMGLGLFLTRVVAERIGGRLDLQSTPGQGTTAVLHLPVLEDTRRATNHRMSTRAGGA
jgi:two-component system, sensor histidine kinase RegB